LTNPAQQSSDSASVVLLFPTLIKVACGSLVLSSRPNTAIFRNEVSHEHLSGGVRLVDGFKTKQRYFPYTFLNLILTCKSIYNIFRQGLTQQVPWFRPVTHEQGKSKKSKIENDQINCSLKSAIDEQKMKKRKKHDN